MRSFKLLLSISFLFPSLASAAGGTDCFVHIYKHIKTQYPSAKIDTTMRYWGPYKAGAGLPLYGAEKNVFSRDGFAYSASWELSEHEALMDAFLLDASCRIIEIKSVYHERQ